MMYLVDGTKPIKEISLISLQYIFVLFLQCGELVKFGYLGDWYRGTQEEKKILLNIMTRGMVQGSFGGFVGIDIYTFINVSTFIFYLICLI